MTSNKNSAKIVSKVVAAHSQLNRESLRLQKQGLGAVQVYQEIRDRVELLVQACTYILKERSLSRHFNTASSIRLRWESFASYNNQTIEMSPVSFFNPQAQKKKEGVAEKFTDE